MTMSKFAHVRKDINSQISEALEAKGIAGEFKYIREGRDGRMLWHIGNEVMTTGEAADRYLTGGFSANFGKAI